jgi:hypothetical protein
MGERIRHGWPALMKAATARAYLDDMPIAEFATTVVPFLDARTGDGCVRYTRDSIDAWIGQGARALRTTASSVRAPGAGDGAVATEGVDLLEPFGLITEEDLAALLGISVKSLKNKPRSDLPEFVKAGRRRLFKEASVRARLEARIVPGFDAATHLNAVAMAGGFTYRARKNDFYIKRLDKDGKMVRIASLRPSSSCLESLFRLLPMSFSRIFRLSRSVCVVLAADALAPVVEGWFVILEVSGVGGRAIF